MTSLPEKKELFDHGHVILEEVMGSDLTIVNAARQSFAQQSDKIGEREIGLINYLMKNKHGTPFEMVDYRFNVKCPISVAREWFRHRIGSFNEMSGRYKELPNEFYMPSRANVRAQTGKPGAYHFEKLDSARSSDGLILLEQTYGKCYAAYSRLIELGWAKELARNVLPVGLYTQFTWKVNLRSLFNFVALRSDSSAMFEIREYSNVLQELANRDSIKIAWEAFEKHHRVTP